jgi:hypothetical protein
MSGGNKPWRGGSREDPRIIRAHPPLACQEEQIVGTHLPPDLKMPKKALEPNKNCVRYLATYLSCCNVDSTGILRWRALGG